MSINIFFIELCIDIYWICDAVVHANGALPNLINEYTYSKNEVRVGIKLDVRLTCRFFIC